MQGESAMRQFHCSIIARKKRILLVETNKPKTHPQNLLNPKIGRDGSDISEIKYLCSEASALLSFGDREDFNKLALYTLRIDRNGKLAYSYPCESCQSLLARVDFKNIFFTDKNGNWTEYEKHANPAMGAKESQSPC